jgi:hypothetical protein
MTPATRALLDAAFPPLGACAICACAICGLRGGQYRDARHRVTDAIRERHRAGDSIARLAREYRLTHAAIRAVVLLPPQAYGAWLRRKTR